MTDPRWRRVDALSDVEVERELTATVFDGNVDAFQCWRRENAEFEALNTHHSVPVMMRLKLYRATA